MIYFKDSFDILFINATDFLEEQPYPYIFSKSVGGKPNLKLSHFISGRSGAVGSTGGSINPPHINHPIPTTSSNQNSIITEGTRGHISLVTLQQSERDLFYLEILQKNI